MCGFYSFPLSTFLGSTRFSWLVSYLYIPLLPLEVTRILLGFDCSVSSNPFFGCAGWTDRDLKTLVFWICRVQWDSCFVSAPQLSHQSVGAPAHWHITHCSNCFDLTRSTWRYGAQRQQPSTTNLCLCFCFGLNPTRAKRTVWPWFNSPGGIAMSQPAANAAASASSASMRFHATFPSKLAVVPYLWVSSSCKIDRVFIKDATPPLCSVCKGHDVKFLSKKFSGLVFPYQQ